MASEKICRKQGRLCAYYAAVFFMRSTVSVVATTSAVMANMAKIADCPRPRLKLNMGFVTGMLISNKRLGRDSFFMGRYFFAED